MGQIAGHELSTESFRNRLEERATTCGGSLSQVEARKRQPVISVPRELAPGGQDS